ncbi:hypothetical protein [Vibrio ulleungensis]|uniref:Oligosaccharide repeat unit polymerase n=1 Tax=Vibrio ulleungensis TaxID=2807619 RepID=A0ABS2HJM3_9VIBR|nr:hypothetical protein [Vibrio ulleungensis]MBM7037713.1 hypothetical protein [Vibrio ulleungensis]
MGSFKLLLPLLLVEVYLVATILLALWGPVNWNFSNTTELLLLLMGYHIAFVIGYLAHFGKLGIKGEGEARNHTIFNALVDKYYWGIMLLAAIGSVISFKNVTMSNTLVWTDLWQGFKLGLFQPWEARFLYAEKLFSGEYKGNKILSASLVLFSIFKYLLVPLLVYRWPALSKSKKFVGVLIATIPLIGGIIMSLSAINFYYFFVIFICLLIILLSFDRKSSQEQDRGLSGLRNRKGILVSLVFIFLFSFWQFYAVKSGSSLYTITVESEKPATFDYLREYGVTFDRDVDEYYGVGYDFYEKVSIYIAQGYKGMSISLSEPFESTYGVGHSVFLQRVFEDDLGFDIRDRTYQRKITESWDENIFWHSAYSYFANDVSFYGVILVMLVLGYYFSYVVHLALKDNNFIAKALLPLFAIMFLYMPANNQVFSFLEYMSPFWVLTSVLLLFSNARMHALVRRLSFKYIDRISSNGIKLI